MTRTSKNALRYARDGLLFVPDFLPAADFAAVRDECRSMRGAMKAEKGSFAIGRAGRFVDSRSKTHRLLTSEAAVQRVSGLVGARLEPSEYPIELRAYRPGSSMSWHRDDQLYAEPQCELVLCLDNSSDSRTEWLDADGELHAAWTPPNSVLLLRAGDTGAAHRVIPLKVGERTILKMMWAAPECARLDAFYKNIDSLPGLRSRRLKQVGRGDERRHRRRRRS